MHMELGWVPKEEGEEGTVSIMGPSQPWPLHSSYGRYHMGRMAEAGSHTATFHPQQRVSLTEFSAFGLSQNEFNKNGASGEQFSHVNPFLQERSGFLFPPWQFLMEESLGKSNNPTSWVRGGVVVIRAGRTVEPEPLTLASIRLQLTVEKPDCSPFSNLQLNHGLTNNLNHVLVPSRFDL